MNFTLNFADGSQSVQTYTASVPDWYGGSNYAALGLGRVGTTFDTATGSINPRLYEEDFTLAAADQTKVVDSITFSNGTSSGASRLNVMAISGSGPNVAQSYANAVNVTHNADIDVSQLLQAAIGPLTVNASTLRLSSADTSGSPYSLATPSISLAGNATVNAAPSAGGGAATLVLGTGQSAAIAVTSGGSNTITANVLLAGNVNVNAASGAALALGGNVTDGGAGYGLTLTGNGSGELILSGSNGYTGGTIVDEGTLLVTNPKALLAGSSLTVGASGTLLFDPSQGGSVVADSPAAAIVPEPSTSTLVSQQGIGAVPEPGTLALLAAGALAAGFAVWRGRRQ
jgi:autotransporter-associated beta strand protein